MKWHGGNPLARFFSHGLARPRRGAGCRQPRPWVPAGIALFPSHPDEPLAPGPFAPLAGGFCSWVVPEGSDPASDSRARCDHASLGAEAAGMDLG